MNNISIAKLKNNEWEKYKQIRLEALKQEPSAFGSSYKETLAKPDKEWKKQLKNANNEEHAIMLFAQDEDKVVGMIGIYWNDKDKTKHLVNIFGVYVNNKYRGQGIGRLLMEAILDKILGVSQFAKIKLSVESNKKAAIGLYKKFGFKTVGLMQKDMRIGQRYVDSYLMEKLI